ncbi:MAG: FGGY-family carbohydrate kinase [Desulfobacterales bacterium]|jgi:xylulokinase|nr:FGGY-family carbohydrate kinase [Desulfobacterales bacterium]
MTDTSFNTSHASFPSCFVLAIDLGSGSVKAAVVSSSGQIMASAGEPVTTFLLPEGGAEQDPKQWWRNTKRAAKTAIKQSGVPPELIAAVCCTSQWSVVVPVNINAEPLMNAVHWLDTRGGPYNRKIIRGFPRIKGYGLSKALQWIRLTGLAPTQSGVDSLGHVLFIRHEKPEIYAATHKFLEPMDFLTSKLTGRITASQKTMAPFMVVENRKWGEQQYSDKLLALAGIEKEKFPELISNDGIIGRLDKAVADDLGLSPSTKVVAGISDSNASAIGSGAVLDYEAIIYIGTSLYMTCHVPYKKTDMMRMMTSLPSPFPSRYYLLGEQGAGGKCVDHFLKNIIYSEDVFNTGPMPESSYLRFNIMAAQSPAGSSGVIFLPWLNGSIVPDEETCMRGGFVNLSLKTTRSDMARSIMEGLAYNNRWTKEAAEIFIRRPIASFRFSGGGAISDLWAQILADVLKTTIHQVDDPVHATLRGAALLGFIALGFITLEDISKLVKIKRVVESEPENFPIYDKMYAQYRQLFSRNRKIFQALNEQSCQPKE